MFDKEAEEYQIEKLEERKDKYVFELPEVYVADIKQAFKDGSEFGYNKANEWHYVKDGDLPKEEGVYLTYRKNGLQLLAFDGAYWITGIQDDVHNTIIAWKEIVLPELKESE